MRGNEHLTLCSFYRFEITIYFKVNIIIISDISLSTEGKFRMFTMIRFGNI